MAGPKKTVWEAEAHTLAKHVILRSYLQAWFPILSKWNGRVVYYDGFAGPGVYSRGEEGSPLIALNVAKEHRASLDSELAFIFVEERKDRSDYLKAELATRDLPSNFRYSVRNETFAQALGNTLDYLDSEGLEIAPTFAFVDPFGITGLPFSLIERLLGRKRCEALITFMSSTIRRFVTELPEQVNELVGNISAAERIESAPDRVVAARREYLKSLRKVVRFVRFFQMRDVDDRPIYDLFFASNSPLGHYKMKEVMWRVDAAGQYMFSDGVDPDQATLFTPNPGPQFAVELWTRFHGRTVDMEEILVYTEDESPFLDKHARAALKLLEAEEGVEGHRINVAEWKYDGTRRKKGTFPKGVSVDFLNR